MRSLILAVVLFGCGSSNSESEPPQPAPAETPAKPEEPAPVAKKPPDQMDEKMRHCPVALDGATSTLEDIEGGVRFTVKVPDKVDEARRRARHVVEFASKRTREGHGGFDGKGGGRMKNCPVVTDGVTIKVNDIPGGAQLDIVADAADVDRLRKDTRARVEKFPFVGATIKIATAGK